MLAQFIANGICTGSIIGLCALGLALIYNTTKIFHFAHAGIYILSVYLFYLLNIILHINLIISFIVSVLFSALISVLIDKIFYIPLLNRKASSTSYLITSLGIYIFITNTIALFFGNETKILRPGIEKTYEFAGIILTKIQIIQFISFVFLLVIISIILNQTNIGRLIRAVSSNYKLSQVIGLDIKKTRVISFGLGSILAGISANLNGLDVGMEPYSAMNIFLNSAVAMIMGGIGYFMPAALSGIILGIIQSLVVYKLSAKWQMASTFVILLIMLIFRPQGLFSRKKRLEEL